MHIRNDPSFFLTKGQSIRCPCYRCLPVASSSTCLQSLMLYVHHEGHPCSSTSGLVGIISIKSFLKWPEAPHSKQTMALVFSLWALGLLLLRRLTPVIGQVAKLLAVSACWYTRTVMVEVTLGT
ncbi:hypothetical protein Tco_0261745 [Tanacetum coccineum]